MSDPNLIGKNISQYRIEEQIGQGGMATVYKAYQSSINRHVAIKILPSQYAQDPNFVKRFEQEARAIAALEHPHILPVYDFGTQDGLTYMVMRYVRGGTLGNLMGTPLSYERIVRLISAVARALDYAHKQGVVHRDIKPSNILIDKNGEALLTDFGIAKLIESSGATQLTGSGTILGTPAYMSPEQAKAEPVDGRSDIYSLGVVLYELLTGQQPFQAETPVAVVLKHVSEPVPPPRSVKPDIPEAMERVVIKAMAKDPNERYQTVGEMEQALQAALRDIESRISTVSVPTTTSSPTQNVAKVVPPPPKKSMVGPLLIGGGAVIALLCVAGGALALFGLISSPDTATPTAVSRSTVSIGIQATATPTAETIVTAAAALASPTTEPAETPEITSTPTAGKTPDTSATTEPIIGIELPDITDSLLLQDNFDDNKNEWFTGDESDEYGRTIAEIVDGRYRVTQEAKKGVFIHNSLSQTKFGDFMISIDATPVEHNASFGYGLTVRENSRGDLYLFEIDTNGYYSVAVRVNDEWTTLQDWTAFEAINADSTNQLSIQVSSSSFIFLINGEFATSVEDDTLKSGSIGVALELYDPGNKATADFDNLSVINFSADMDGLLDSSKEPASSVLFEDTFDSDANGWATGEFDDEFSTNTVTIENGKYTISVQDKDQAFVEKLLPNREFDDFILTVETTPRDTEEHYSYGVSFRENSSGDIFYAFEIGNDGQYAVLLYDGDWKRLKDWSTSQALKPGETNTIKIVAQGRTLEFYVNEVKLTALENDASSSGKVGLVVAMFEQGKSATVDFDNLVISQP
jgi:serine/threonine protein kinase